jgi:hypothetical protein
MDGKQTLSIAEAETMEAAGFLDAPIPAGWLGFPDSPGFWWALAKGGGRQVAKASLIAGEIRIQLCGSATEYCQHDYACWPDWIFQRIDEPATVPGF